MVPPDSSALRGEELGKAHSRCFNKCLPLMYDPVPGYESTITKEGL
jgi:hypothetical protein